MGGRSLFNQHPAAINILEMDDPGVVTDADTPEDFAVWHSQYVKLKSITNKK